MAGTSHFVGQKFWHGAMLTALAPPALALHASPLPSSLQTALDPAYPVPLRSSACYEDALLAEERARNGSTQLRCSAPVEAPPDGVRYEKATFPVFIPKCECERVMREIRAYCKAEEPLGDLNLDKFGCMYDEWHGGALRRAQGRLLPLPLRARVPAGVPRRAAAAARRVAAAAAVAAVAAAAAVAGTGDGAGAAGAPVAAVAAAAKAAGAAVAAAVARSVPAGRRPPGDDRDEPAPEVVLLLR